MENHFGKYIRLFGSIFFLVLGVITTLVLFLLGMKLLFGLLQYVPWTLYIYILFIILVPPTLFITVYLIYFRRTRSHPSRAVRWISWFLFIVALGMWLVFLVMDMITFFKTGSSSIGLYYAYDMIFLASNVACIFLVGVIQALTTEKEKDWMDRDK